MKRVLVLCLGGSVLAACQPQLNSDLPSGQAAYQEIADPGREQMAGLLQSGDVLRIDVFQEEDLSMEETTIDRAGNVSLPLLGVVKAAGLSVAELTGQLEQGFGATYVRNPRVNVSVMKESPRTISVEGDVEAPGVYEARTGYTLLTALALAESPSVEAKLDEVLIFRELDGQRFGARFDVTDIRAGRLPDPAVYPGDVVVVGHSKVREGFEDFIRIAPNLLGVFVRY